MNFKGVHAFGFFLFLRILQIAAWLSNPLYSSVKYIHSTFSKGRSIVIYSSSDDSDNRAVNMQFSPEELRGLVDVGTDSTTTDNESTDEEQASIASEKSQILNVITLIAEHFAIQKSLDEVDPSIFTENAHILCRGRLYEEVMGDLISQSTNERVTSNLQKIDALIRGFITAERKSRSRLKINYLLAAAAANKFEQAMEALSLSDEVDDELQSFVRQMIKKEEDRIGGLESILNENDELVYDPQHISDSDKKMSQALPVLKMIYKRIKAESLTSSNSNLKFLNTLLRCKPDQRISLLENHLRRVEQLMDFSEYVKNALSFVEENDGRGQQGGERIQLGADTIEILRDITRDMNQLLDRLKTGKNDGVLFEKM